MMHALRLHAHLRRVLGCLALGMSLSALGACVEVEVCKPYAQSSVALTIVDAESGDPVPDVMITYQLDGGAMLMPDDLGDSRFTLAWEQTGVFTVSIEAEGYEPVQKEYVVTQDEDDCHVNGIGETIELVPLS